MGSCMCKRKRSSGPGNRAPAGGSVTTPVVGMEYGMNRGQRRVPFMIRHHPQRVADHPNGSNGTDNELVCLWVYSEDMIDDLIGKSLMMIRDLVSNDQEPPSPLIELNAIAEREGGWISVVMSMIRVIPVHESLGTAVIKLFLEESPLPSKETILRLFEEHLHLHDLQLVTPSWRRNISIVLGALAEKLAGPSCVQICTDIILNYLIKNLDISSDPQVILFSLVALEKFAQTSENRLTISRRLEQFPEHPLLILEDWFKKPSTKREYVEHQVAFCAQWALDNIFVLKNRTPSYVTCDISNINAMLNHEDVSEYLKIAPNGLEARCDVSSFESVRCTFEATRDTWFYEVLILTPGVMQIGFATKRSRFYNHDGFGIGDNSCSVGYDGCRRLIWHNAKHQKIEHNNWKPGDILGCLLNLNDAYVQFYLNGRSMIKPHTQFVEKNFSDQNCGFFAAASFMSFQQCQFNFGHKPFRYPPSDVKFKTFNDHGNLTKEQKTILTRHQKAQMLSELHIRDDACSLCYSNPANTSLKPCDHGGICHECSNMLDRCPLCRKMIVERVCL